MLTPTYKLTIGNKVIDTTDKPQASTVVDLKVALDMDTPADSLSLLLGRVGKFKPQPDDDAKVELGYADDDNGLTQVMTGTIDNLEPTLTSTRVVAYTSAASLLRTFADQTYENKTAAEIVRDLADQASVTVARTDDGVDFPAYVVDGRRSVYYHMHDLADLCGFDLYVNSDGELVFEKFVGGKTVHILEFAKHILHLEAQETPPHATQVQAWGESPGAGKGEEAWAWLTKDFSGLKGTAGSGNPTFLLERPALRTADAASTAAQAEFTRLQRRGLRGRLLTLGSPQITLGDGIHLRNVPEDSLNKVFQVRAITHHIAKQSGFTTTVEFQSFST
jgi:phage protein D